MQDLEIRRRASQIALLQGFALITTNDRIYKLHPNGGVELLCFVGAYECLWHKVLMRLEALYGKGVDR